MKQANNDQIVETTQSPQEKILNKHVIASVAGGLIPIPLIDIATVTAIQMDMIKQLCQANNQEYVPKSAKIWISSIAGSTLSKIGAMAIKAIPGFGTIIGIASMAALSGATTYALGKVLIEHFEKGGTLENFDIQTLRAFYRVKFEEGKKVAQKYYEDGKKVTGTYKDKLYKKGIKQALKNSDIAEKLIELGQLKAKGEISEEEFEKRKEEIFQ